MQAEVQVYQNLQIVFLRRAKPVLLKLILLCRKLHVIAILKSSQVTLRESLCRIDQTWVQLTASVL
jgi:hypothetical protein